MSQFRSRGVALVLVVAVVALTVVMSLAALSTASLQAQIKGNNILAAQAQYLAESGVNQAVYYLQNPIKAPSLNATGFYPGQTGLVLGGAVDGTVDVTVTKYSTDTYDIVAVAYAGPNPQHRTSRRLKVRVFVNYAYVVDQAALFNTDFTMPAAMTINGDVRCDGSFNNSGGVLNGDVQASSTTNVTGATGLPDYPLKACPTIAQLKMNSTLAGFPPSYTYRDAAGAARTGYAQPLPVAVTGTLSPAVNNPKNVWYSNNNVTLGDCTINGTIFIRGAGRKLIVDGDAHITAVSGMPAVVVTDSIQFTNNGSGSALTVAGVAFTGNQVEGNGAGAVPAALQIDGALMMGGASPAINASFLGTVTVNFVAANVKLTDFSDVNRIPQSVVIQRWGL